MLPLLAGLVLVVATGGTRFDPHWDCDGARIAGTRGKDAVLWDLRSGKVLVEFKGHTEPVNVVTFSPNGKRIATGAGYVSEIHGRATDTSARVWDAATGKQIFLLDDHRGPVRSVQFSPDGRRILTSGDTLWDASSGRKLFRFSTSRVREAEFSADGQTILTGESPRVTVWSATDGKEVCHMPPDERRVSFESAVFSPDGARVLTTDLGDVARIWDAHTGKELFQLVGHESWMSGALFTPDGKRVVTGSQDRSVRIWDAATGKELRKLPSQAPVTQILLSPDGKRCLAKFGLGYIGNVFIDHEPGATLWNIETGREIITMRDDQIWGHGLIGFTPDSKHFLKFDGKLRISSADYPYAIPARTVTLAGLK